MRISKIVLILSSLTISQSVFAFGFPTFDFAAVSEEMNVYDSNMQILQNAKQQYETSKNELVSMTQPTDWYNMFNTPEEIQARLYTAQSWEDALNGKTGSNTKYNQALVTYDTNHPQEQSDAYEKSHTPAQFKHYNEYQKTVKTVAVTSQAEYSNTDQYVKNIQAIGKEASGSKNTGVKSAVDLNTRMLEQIGYLMASNIRLQAVNNNLSTSNAQRSLDQQHVNDEFYAKKG